MNFCISDGINDAKSDKEAGRNLNESMNLILTFSLQLNPNELLSTTLENEMYSSELAGMIETSPDILTANCFINK